MQWLKAELGGHNSVCTLPSKTKNNVQQHILKSNNLCGAVVVCRCSILLLNSKKWVCELLEVYVYKLCSKCLPFAVTYAVSRRGD